MFRGIGDMDHNKRLCYSRVVYIKNIEKLMNFYICLRRNLFFLYVVLSLEPTGILVTQHNYLL